MTVFEVNMILYRRKKSEEIFLKLQTDKLLGTHISQCLRAARVFFIPIRGDGLAQKIDPASIRGGQR